MNIGCKNIEWVDHCVYLDIESVITRTFGTCAERNKRKFCSAVNDALSPSKFLSEEC